MKRATRLLAIIAACATSALALAQSPDAAPDDTAATDAQPHASRYVDLRRVQPLSGNVAAGEAKSGLCVACHGPQGVSVVPTFPNIAGQSMDFMYWQLVEYKRNQDSPMSPLVADLSEQDMLDLSAYYASLTPPPVGPAAEPALVDASLAGRGEQLYLAGDPAKGIPPCQGCHGIDANGHADALRTDRDGHTPYASYPALRSQQAIYLQTKLAQYRNGEMDDSTTDFVMTGVAERLDDDSIEALSAWLSALPPGQ